MGTCLRTRHRALALAAAIVAGTGCDSEPAPTPLDPSYHVKGGFLRDPDGRALLLRGLNLAGGHKQAPYLDFQQPPDYVRVKDPWGMNAVRFLLTWAAIEPAEGVYDDVIVGFDPMNEPYWGSYVIVAFESDLLQPLYEQIVAAVRAERPGWVAFLEPAASRNLGIPTSLGRFPFADVMYAPHSYDRDAESGMGFDATHRDAVLQNGADLAVEATALGAGLWIGEYGGQTGTPGITPYMDAEYAAFAASAAGTTYWSYDRGGGYSVLDADGNEKPDLMAVLVRPWPERVAGTPVSYAFDAGTDTFTLTYHPDPAMILPTVIRVPDRVYPNGYTVDCSGCATESAPGELRVTRPPVTTGGAPAVVTLRP